MFRLVYRERLSYRVAALAGSATQFFWGFMLICVFQAFSSGAGSAFGPQRIASYVWLQQAFLALFVIWYRDNDLIAVIVSGEAANDLCRPLGLYASWFTRLLAGRLSAASLRALPILVVAALLPQPFRLEAPASLGSALAFALSMVFASALMTALSIFVYVLCLRTRNFHAALLLVAPLSELLSGTLLPLPFFPSGLSRVVSLLPFRFCADLPLRAYSGSIGPDQALALCAAQAAWLMAALILGKLALNRALKGAAG